MNDQKLCVIMCAFNAEKTIAQAVNSIIKSVSSPSIVIVDDCSKIPISTYLADCLEDKNYYSRCTILRNEQNLGPAGSRNLAAVHARTLGFEYVAILDADDLVDPRRFELQMAEFDLRGQQVAVVASWAYAVDENSLEILSLESYSPASAAEMRQKFLFDNHVINSTAVVRLSIWEEVGGMDTALRTAEDFDFYSKIALVSDIVAIPLPLVLLRQTSTSISRSGVTAQRRARLKVLLRYLPRRARNPRAWLGVGISAARVLIPTFIVETYKSLSGSRRVAG